jgi:hypothetical protein
MKTNKNSLNISITRPNQVLIVMRGIPGGGKSTKAKQLAGSNGVIHSTDDVIEAQGDYNQFFKDMIDSKDFTPLSRAHSTNLKNLFKSLKDGISPVILDNTNIKQNEAKAAVKAAVPDAEILEAKRVARYTPPGSAPKQSMGRQRQPFMPGEVDNTFPGAKFKDGGKVRSASARADGIAIRGKTRA